AVDNAADAVEDAADDEGALERVGRKADKVGSAIGEAAKRTHEAVTGAAKETHEAVKDATGH
ncbi:MAG: hypothetical protein HKP27_17310, partial [Myxococcales bacterium]|nr:hypothetical protein [Myxococcales bacterium]